MADQPTTPSGSRWEPDPDSAATAEAPAAADPPPATSYDAPDIGSAPTPHPLDEPALDEPADDRHAQLRGRAVLAGAATALALGGGVAGFVIGHSTAGNDTGTFRPTGFTSQQDGGQPGGQPGQGQQPPGFDHDGDRDGDGDGDGDGDHGFGQPPQGSTDGGSSSSSSGNGAGVTGNPT